MDLTKLNGSKVICTARLSCLPLEAGASQLSSPLRACIHAQAPLCWQQRSRGCKHHMQAAVLPPRSQQDAEGMCNARVLQQGCNHLELQAERLPQQGQPQDPSRKGLQVWVSTQPAREQQGHPPKENM